MQTAFLAIACVAVPSIAQLVVTAGAPSDAITTTDAPLGPFSPGSSIAIPFFAHLGSSQIPNPLTTYSFTIDLGGDGEGLPSGGSTDFFSSFMGELDPAVGGNFDFSAVSGFLELDFIVEWNGSVALSTDAATPTKLFDLTFDTSPMTPAGLYDITIPTGLIASSQTSLNSNEIPITDLLFDNGQIAIASLNTLAGDYNQDGDVSASDLSFWEDEFGSSSLPGSGADGDGNGIIEGNDFLIWQRNFGSTVPSSSPLPTSTVGAVPEASSVALLTLALGGAASLLRVARG